MAQLSEALIHPPGTKFHLNDFDAEETHGVDKARGIAGLEKNVERLAVLQYLLYAEAKRSVLIVLQGIDAAGKDGVVRHVMAGMNPQGVSVTPFKVPEGEEKRHDYSYMDAYDDVIEKCSTRHAPWHVIPSNRKWFRNYAVSEVVCSAMEKMGIEYPKAATDLSKIEFE